MNLDKLIADVLELDEKATKGPWIGDEDSTSIITQAPITESRTFGYTCENDFIADLQDQEYHNYKNDTERIANAEFIAKMRTQAPLLAKACQRMKEALEAYVKGTDFRGFKDLKGFRDYWEASQRYAEKTLADVDALVKGEK